MLIPKEVFNVSKCAARESSRYALNGVRVERGEGGVCRAITTDGRRLMVAEWSDEHLQLEYPPVTGAEPGNFGPGDGVIISAKQWDEAGKAIPKNGIARAKPILNNCHLDEGAVLAHKVTDADGDRPCPIRLTSTDLDHERAIKGHAVEGHFPKWQDFMPNYRVGENAVEIGVNPAYLAEVCKVVEATATDEDSRGVRLVIPTDPKRPMLVQGRAVGTGVEGKAVIMPVNLNANSHPDGYDDEAAEWSVLRKAPEMLRVLTAVFDSSIMPQLAKGTANQRALHDYIGELVTKLGRDWAEKPVEEANAEEETGEATDEEPVEPEIEETAQVNATESGDVVDKPDAPGPVGDAATDPPRVPDEVQREEKRVTVRKLRTVPDKVAPVSGARCRRCGASAHRAKFSPNDTWLVADGAAYCPVCEAAISTEGGAR